MDVQTCDQLLCKVQSLEQQIVPMKEWRGKEAVKTVSVDSLGDVEEELLSTLEQTKALAQKTFDLDEKKFIEAANTLSNAIGCLLVLRNECKIVDYKALSTPKKVGKFFKEFFREYTYIPTKHDPIDVLRAQQELKISIQDMLLHQAPWCAIPNRKTEENVWGVAEREGGPRSPAVRIWMGQQDTQPKIFDAIVTLQGISVYGISGQYESWEDAARGIREFFGIAGVFKAAPFSKRDAEKKLEKFVVKEDPPRDAFPHAWYIKKRDTTYFFVKGADICPIGITVEGYVFTPGATPKKNIEEVLGETEQTCVAKIYRDEREKTIKNIRSKGVQGAYRDEKIYFSGGEKEIDLSRENEFGAVIVYDMERVDLFTLVCVRPGFSVSGTPFEIQENGTILPELDVEAISFGCLKRLFFSRERKIFERMVGSGASGREFDVDGLRRCCMAKFCEVERVGYRFVCKRPENGFIPLISKIINKFLLSVNTNQPEGYAVEIFSPYKKLYYPLSFQNDSFVVDTCEGIVSDISVEGISRKIETTWKATSLARIYEEISENRRKVEEAVKVIESIQIESEENPSLKSIETRLSIPSELNILGQHEVWNTFDSIGCTWVYENKYMFSLRQKGRSECTHFALDIWSDPGKIVMQYQDYILEAPVEEFKKTLETTFSKIAFPKIWDRKYREIKPFIDAFRAVNHVPMTKETFFKNVRFLGENAGGALYVETSDIGKVALYGVSGRTPTIINLLSAVQSGVLTVDGALYGTVESFLYSFSNKKWQTLHEIEQLVVEKKVIISTYVTSQVVHARVWASFEKKHTGRRLWEICFFRKNFWNFLPFFSSKRANCMTDGVVLRLSADGKKNIPLDFVLKEEKWWIRADHKEFSSLPELLGTYGLKAEDRYELVS